MVQQCFVHLNKKQIYDTFDFTLEETYHNLQIQLQIEEKLIYKIFVFLEDPNHVLRFQKMISHGEHRYQIGNEGETTSLGGYPGPIPKGTWRCSIYTLHENYQELFQEESVVTVTISGNVKEEVEGTIGSIPWVDYKAETNTLTLSKYDESNSYHNQPMWYAGDFHTHTRLSDGKAFVPEAMEHAGRMNLHFYVTTEHNVIHTGMIPTQILVIPGIEMTTEFGHLNIFGLKEVPDWVIPMLASADDHLATMEKMVEVLEANRQKGYINSINHPFLHVWKWEIFNTPLELIDTIEIINDPIYDYAKESNDLAITFIDLLWEDGYHIYGVGGSDAHNLPEERYEGANLPSIVGDPKTIVYSDTLSSKAILENVKKGHICISRFIDIQPKILLTMESNAVEVLPGDQLPNVCITDPYTIEYQVTLNHVREDLLVTLLVDGKPRKVQKVEGTKGDQTVCFLYEGEKKSYSWIRIDIRNLHGDFIGYINPIYVGEKKHQYCLYQDAWEALHKQIE